MAFDSYEFDCENAARSYGDVGQSVALVYGVPRSPHWAKVSRDFLQENPYCLVCGERHNNFLKAQVAGLEMEAEGNCLALQVHHKVPFHFVHAVGRPDLELDKRNLCTLCEVESNEHHLLVGHLGNFASYNHQLNEDILWFSGMSRDRIKRSPRWQEKVKARPVMLGAMSDIEKHRLRQTLDRLYPPLQATTVSE